MREVLVALMAVTLTWVALATLGFVMLRLSLIHI